MNVLNNQFPPLSEIGCLGQIIYQYHKQRLLP